MRQTDHNLRQVRLFSALVCTSTALLILFALLLTARAQASPFEQSGTFAGILKPPANPGEFPEEVQLGGVGGMAVNIDGVGGVPPGTIYAATKGPSGGDVRIARFTPSGDGLKFVEGWQVLPFEAKYERCGPLLGTETKEGKEVAKFPCPTRASAAPGAVDVEIDQATGNVYVLSGDVLNPESFKVNVYSPDGSEVIAQFGHPALPGEATAKSPGKIHESPYPGGIGVNSAGEVYVFDVNGSDKNYHRLMVFKPEPPGDYENYVYAGQERDVGVGTTGNYPTDPAVDTAGDIYVAGDAYIEKYDPAKPSKPICEFKLGIGGITTMTVNPETGEPFYYTSKNKNLHQLSACNEKGEFTQTSEFTRTIAPKRGDIYGLAFDPKRQIEINEIKRPAGALYGGVPEPQAEASSGAIGYIFAPAVESPPLVESEGVMKVGPTSAELRAQINPKGFETSYAFEYLSDAAFIKAGESFEGATETPPGGAVLGSGQSGLSAAAAITGLEADTGYHYRVIAKSKCAPSEAEKVCTTTGAAKTFRTYPFEEPGPPDNRAYELVSPPEKHGGQVLPAEPSVSSCGQKECKPGTALQHFPMQSTPDGETVVFEGTPFNSGEGATLENEYFAHRTETGWSTTNLTPGPLFSKGGEGYKAFDPSLTQGVFEQTTPSLGPPAPSEFTNLYLQPTANPLALTPLVAEEPPNRKAGTGTGSLKLTYAGGSADFSRLFFEANDELAEGAEGGAKEEINLYEWSAGQLHLVNIGPKGEAIPGAGFGSGSFKTSYAISRDGTRAFFSSKAGQAYLRLNGTTTVEIPDSAGEFLSAAADGSKVLLSDGHLYTDLEAEPPSEEADLSQGKVGFQGIIGQSEDLSHVYFVDTAVLDETPNGQGAVAKAGQDNLYAWVEGTTTFIATLLAEDNSETGDWLTQPSVRRAEASPDGNWVSFLSKAPLTGFDNVGPCQIDGETGEFHQVPCPEAFLYNSTTDKLSCPSCNSSGARPLGRTLLRLIATGPVAAPQPRYLTNAGRLYFDSEDSLVPADTNNGVEDVYQFEPNGVGGCEREGGCVALISAGREGDDSNFLAMDEAGNNVFFTSRDRLVGADKEKLVDLYDARVEGGFASESELLPAPCQGEGCQEPPVGAPPEELTPGTPKFKGEGNISEPHKPPKCHKNQVRRGKRCVKKPSHRRPTHHRRGGK